MAGTTGTLEKLFFRWGLLAATLASIALVLAAAVWSAAEQRAEGIADLSAQQALLATAVSTDFEERLTIGGEPPGDAALLDLLAGAKRIEAAQNRLVLVARPGAHGFLTTDNRIIPSTRLRAALDARERSLALPRDEAVAFGLPPRTAVAGLAHVGDWGIVVVSSAERLRDRQIMEERRLAATVLFASVVVAAFGFVARRRQRAELALERRMLERERELALANAGRMAAIAALSTGIAHEIGTPLGVILGRTEQVLDRAGDERTKAALGVVLEQVDRIRRIVRGCLALARGDAPELVSASPGAIATRVVDLVRHRFDNAGVDLVCSITDELGPIACEPWLFEQAIVNLLLNACEVTSRAGQVRFAVEQNELEVHFVVDDDGVGIPDEIAKRSKEPFFTTRLADGGSGLGLTIANEIVSHHRGSLTIERREGGGTRARIVVSSVRNSS